MAESSVAHVQGLLGEEFDLSTIRVQEKKPAVPEISQAVSALRAADRQLEEAEKLLGEKLGHVSIANGNVDGMSDSDESDEEDMKGEDGGRK